MLQTVKKHTGLTSVSSKELKYISQRLELAGNALSKVRGGVRALRRRFKNIKRVEDLENYDDVINTLVNMLNRIVEVRNIVSEVRDSLKNLGVEAGDLTDRIENLVTAIDRASFRLSLVALNIVARLRTLTRDDSGRLASAIGTAVFTSLLSLHVDDVRNSMAACLPRTGSSAKRRFTSR